MAIITERDRNRLATLIARIKPPHSIAARLETLTDAQRAQYDHYSERMSAFIARNDIDEEGNPGNAYRLISDGYGPQLSNAIDKALFGEMPKILKTDTDDEAARKWMECLQ